jgi:hypothetical protein
MKIVRTPCTGRACYARLDKFADAQAAMGHPLQTGSIVECDCRGQYELPTEEAEGRIWLYRIPVDPFKAPTSIDWAIFEEPS